MFIVKAEIRSNSSPAPYTLFQAERVCVRPARIGQSSGIAPDIEVELIDRLTMTFEWLYVGRGLEHYSAVYIMNERGKTIESIYPPSTSEAIPVRAA